MNIIHNNKPITVKEKAVVIREFAGLNSGEVVIVEAITGNVATVAGKNGYGEPTIIPLVWLVWVP